MLPLLAPEDAAALARADAAARSARLWEDDPDPAWEARNAATRERWAYYEGRHPRPLEVEPGATDDNTVLNLARPIIDRGVSFLFGKPTRMQLDETPDADTALEEAVRDVWAKSGGITLMQELAQNGGIAGAAFVKIIPTPEGPLPCRLVNLEPCSVNLAWAHGDASDILGYRIQFEEEDVLYRQDITRDAGPGSTWTITDWTGEETIPGVVSWALQDVTAWPYPLPPIGWCKNLPRANVPWGYSDLEDAALNNAVNAIISSSRKTLREFADPQTFLSGMSGEGLRRGGDQIWYSEDPEADAKNLEMQSDLAAARQFYMDLRAALMMIARLPDVALIGDKLGAVTNFGLRVLFADLIEKNDTKRALYGGLISQVNAVIAMLATNGTVTDAQTTITWEDPLPRDELAHVQYIQALKATGLVSDETLTARLGFSWADEQDRIKAERARAAQAATPAQPGGNAPAGQNGAMMVEPRMPTGARMMNGNGRAQG